LIYLDFAATTPCLPEVVEAMMPFFRHTFGNAASVDHLFGSSAKTAVERARQQVAKLVDGNPEDVLFTSGSTEANNLVLSAPLDLMVGEIEHPSIRDTAMVRGSAHSLTWISVNKDGVYQVREISTNLNLGESEKLVSIMTVNNEVGTIQPIAEVSLLMSRDRHFLHSDASQAASYLRLSMSDVDALSLSSHKIYGPKGVGALVCKPRLRRRLRPTSYGGGHERGLRSGTLNVPGIVGFGTAAAASLLCRQKRLAKLSETRLIFERALVAGYHGMLKINGGPTAAPHILSVTLNGTNARALVNACRNDVCFSLGSACATGKSEPSHVLLAMGLSEDDANETIRCSFSHETTPTEASLAASLICERANALRAFSAA
jgi:cysteine desulfurase